MLENVSRDRNGDDELPLSSFTPLTFIDGCCSDQLHPLLTVTSHSHTEWNKTRSLRVMLVYDDHMYLCTFINRCDPFRIRVPTSKSTTPSRFGFGALLYDAMATRTWAHLSSPDQVPFITRCMRWTRVLPPYCTIFIRFQFTTLELPWFELAKLNQNREGDWLLDRQIQQTQGLKPDPLIIFAVAHRNKDRIIVTYTSIPSPASIVDHRKIFKWAGFDVLISHTISIDPTAQSWHWEPVRSFIHINSQPKLWTIATVLETQLRMSFVTITLESIMTMVLMTMGLKTHSWFQNRTHNAFWLKKRMKLVWVSLSFHPASPLKHTCVTLLLCWDRSSSSPTYPFISFQFFWPRWLAQVQSHFILEALLGYIII